MVAALRQVAALAALLQAGACSAARLPRGSLESGGRTRTYLIARPEPRPRGPLPLVLALHGRGGDGQGQARLSGLDALARREGFLAVFPDGVDRSWADGRGTTPAALQGVDDVAFLSALIDKLVATEGVDPRRVYVIGMSNGGFMAVTLACAIPERLAAMASVTGSVPVKLAARCAAGPPVPAAFFLGDKDPLVPFEGGAVRPPGAHGEVLSAEASARNFASRNGCAADPAPEALPPLLGGEGSTGVTCSAFCAGPAEALLYVIHGGGHAWPGGGTHLPRFFEGLLVSRASQNLDASVEAWRFFSRHAR